MSINDVRKSTMESMRTGIAIKALRNSVEPITNRQDLLVILREQTRFIEESIVRDRACDELIFS